MHSTLHGLLVAGTGALLLCGAVSGQPGQHVPGSMPSNPYEPLQHRLAYAGTLGEGMSVQWNTYGYVDQPTVYYGEFNDVSKLTNARIGESATYNTSLTWTNTVVLNGLSPHTKYYYYVSHTNCTGCEQIPLYSFKTAIKAGDMTPYSIGVVGDMGLWGDYGNVDTAIGPVMIAGLSVNGPGKPTAGAPGM